MQRPVFPFTPSLYRTSTPRVIIVGASSGIGYALAELYIARGYRVGLAARRLEPLKELQARAPKQVSIEYIDTTRLDRVLRLRSLIDQLGSMDIFVHCSGIGYQNPDLDAEVELSTLEVNVSGFTAMVGYAFDYFERQGWGQLAAVTSVAGTRGLGVAPAYSSSKAYQATYLQSLRQLIAIRELTDIYVTDIRPGFVDTPLMKGRRMPMMMRPERVARSIARAIAWHSSVWTVDWRYSLLVGLWRLIPRVIWEHLPIGPRKRDE